MKKLLRACFITLFLPGFALAAPPVGPVTATPNENIGVDAMPTLSPAPVSQEVSSATSGVFQKSTQNLNLYVTQLQCQSATSDTSTCSSINNVSNPQNPSVMDSVNKFLFNSVSSELGVGVEIHF
jgi:hypothetical protein